MKERSWQDIFIDVIYYTESIINISASSDISAIAEGEKSFDSFIKDYIRKNLSYRYLITQNTVVRSLESHIQSFGINNILPTINGRANKPVTAD